VLHATRLTVRTRLFYNNSMMLTIMKMASGAAGIILSMLVILLPRFGKDSWKLVLFLLPAGIAGGIWIINGEDSTMMRAEFSCILMAAAGGYFSLDTFQSEKAAKYTIKRKLFRSVVIASSIMLSVSIHVITPIHTFYFDPAQGLLALGLAGYLAALFLLIISVTVLASLEQVLRCAEETVRWQIKFLLLGMATSFATMIYISSKILLSPLNIAYLSNDSLALFSVLFIISCALIIYSWLRSSGRTSVVLSHGVIYSSITLLSVGIYLIASSLFARWASSRIYFGIPSEALTYLLLLIVMATILLATGFRHRVRNWIRRNILAGRYDYRQYWLDATERVQSTNTPQLAADSLVDIVYRALGAIDVTVWIRRWNPNRLNRLSILGSPTNIIEAETEEVINEIMKLAEPISIQDLQALGKSIVTIKFMENNRAALLVPLVSSNRIVGLLTVGANRSGRAYGWEAREFLHALGRHAAGEFHKMDLLSTLIASKEDEAFRTFATFVLHDLKNFASTLSLIAQNAVRFQDNADFQKDSFRSVRETADKMKRLCNSLRTFSTNLADNKKLEDLNEIIRSVVETSKIPILEQIHFDLAPLPRLRLDAEEIARVIQNLVLNAQQAIASNGEIWIHTCMHNGTVKMSVEDNGKGMSRQFIEKELFLPFHTTKSDGLGIGLFQTKKILDAHSAQIQITSHEGEGTSVAILFNRKID
jgi:putative PEP-CTERM system histidine kinase